MSSRSGSVLAAALALVAAWFLLTWGVLDRLLGLSATAVALGGAVLLLPAGFVFERMVARIHGRAVEELNARLSLLLRHLPSVVWTTDRDLRFTSARGRGLTDLGVSEEDLVGTTIGELFRDLPEDAPPMRGYRRALEGRAVAFDVRWNERSWKVRLEPLRKGAEVVGIVGAAMDVTDEEEARRRLEEQRAHFRQLFEESPEGIVLVDEQDVILDANSEFLRMFGYERTEVLGRPVNDLIVPEGRFGEAVDLTRRAAAGDRIETEAVRRRKDGSLVDVSILATHLDLGDRRRVYGIYRDITQQKATELQLLHSQRLEAVGQLAGGVAHDFNNILTVILGQTHTLLEEAPSGDLRRDLEQIEAAASRAADLTRQLLTFSRRDVVATEAVDLNELLDEIREFLERSLGERIELVLDPAERVPPVRADPGQLQQVLMNLLINARDAMPEGGRVEIRTRSEGPDDSVVLLEVADTGTGMTDEVAARIFEPFFTTKPRGQGTGLGMSTAYGIVERAGGTIDVETAPGEGTTFRIRMPATTDEDEAAVPVRRARADASPAPDRRAAILLVDDDLPVLEIARIILERRGYRVITAESGPAGLRAALAMDRPPDLLLTDLVMPEMSGQKLAEQVRSRWPDLRVLFMTGYTEGQWARELEMRPGGTEAILQKPFDPNTLVRRVREALSRE